jgi:uroporphyrinogen decarboxylase
VRNLNVEAMNAYQRVMTVFDGKRPDATPVVPMVKEWCYRQAGLEYDLEEHQVEKHVYAQSYSQSTFGYDVVLTAYGPHSESEAMGSVLKITKGYIPSIAKPAVESYETDLPRLKLFDPYRNRRLTVILEGERRLKNRFVGEVPVMGFVQAPFRHACMLRGTEHVMRDMYRQKEKLQELCEIALFSLIVYAVAVISAGADIIMIADPTSSADLISKRQWEAWGLPLTRKLVNVMRPHGVKTILHVCGDTSDRFESLAETGVDCLSLDEAADLEKARRVLGADYCLMGNVSINLLLFGTQEQVQGATEEAIAKAGRNGPLLISGGCEIPEVTKPENMTAMVKAARAYPT